MLTDHTAEKEVKRLPGWLRRKPGSGDSVRSVKKLLRSRQLNTVCEEARCPNLGECFDKGQATFLILGELCTRACGFCSVKGGRPLPPDTDEPARIASAAGIMGISYVVITSVTRDDIGDGGASHFAATIRAIRERSQETAIEVLTPDFQGDMASVETVCAAAPDVYNHNVETVPALYELVRPAADYGRSLELLSYVKRKYPRIATKSGIMLGLGEKQGEVVEVLHDLKKAGCDMVTIGQYMKPTRNSLEVIEYIEPDIFLELEKIGRKIGFSGVYSGPLVRSSFNAEHFMKGRDIGGVLQN